MPCSWNDSFWNDGVGSLVGPGAVSAFTLYLDDEAIRLGGNDTLRHHNLADGE